MVFITHFLLRISKRESETIQCVNISKANLKPMTNKLVKFGKKLKGKDLPYDNKNYGLSWYKDSYGNLKYKYKSPYMKDYNREKKTQDEIIIYAKPKKLAVYIFYRKDKQIIYFGVTDCSFTFHPNQCVHIYCEEVDSLEEIPLFVDVCFVNGSKNVNEYRRDFRKSPVPVVMLSFRPRIFSSNFDISDLENPVYGEPNIVNNIILPYTGIRRRELIKNWMDFKNGIPRQVPSREVEGRSNVVHRVLEDGNFSDEEPLDVRRDRLRRNRAIEAAIEAANFDIDEVTLNALPEPDQNGYIHFQGLDTDNYDINNPRGLFRGFKVDDMGNTDYFAINGQFFKFNPDSEVKVDPGQFAFYWCPQDGSFGIRYKKEQTLYNSDSGNGNGNNNGEGDNENERVRAPMVNKYIYMKVLNPGFMGEMRPTTVDFYTRSYYHLGRLEYDQINIDHKDQVLIPKIDFETAWENRINAINN